MNTMKNWTNDPDERTENGTTNNRQHIYWERPEIVLRSTWMNLFSKS